MKSKGKNKKYIFWTAAIGLFGIAGLLLVPAAMYIIKLSDRYPKVFRWILCKRKIASTFSKPSDMR